MVIDIPTLSMYNYLGCSAKKGGLVTAQLILMESESTLLRVFDRLNRKILEADEAHDRKFANFYRARRNMIERRLNKKREERRERERREQRG